jgi:hypothetical protein
MSAHQPLQGSDSRVWTLLVDNQRGGYVVRTRTGDRPLGRGLNDYERVVVVPAAVAEKLAAALRDIQGHSNDDPILVESIAAEALAEYRAAHPAGSVHGEEDQR